MTDKELESLGAKLKMVGEKIQQNKTEELTLLNNKKEIEDKIEEVLPMKTLYSYLAAVSWKLTNINLWERICLQATTEVDSELHRVLKSYIHVYDETVKDLFIYITPTEEVKDNLVHITLILPIGHQLQTDLDIDAVQYCKLLEQEIHSNRKKLDFIDTIISDLKV